MAKKCFLSFHYKADSWQVSQIKQIGSIEEQPILDANKWEEIKKKGDGAIEKWIADNMKDKDCLVVLVGEKTAGRRWVKHEIKKAWKDGIGVLAIYIHNLKGSDSEQTTKGSDPFANLTVDGVSVTGKTYDPPYTTSKKVYDYIASNIESWVDAAIKARK
ncbi:TIR domain-containing protein [Methylobacterium sp. J-077]|uniref:TIR domain-containing protein n=1 Tax=Methylobacterium sp. J-077 TaxID=2836656 RepID=UPI001FB99ADA|nr:TIR domain-containing protein [Methylobacterium sp. J-077]MCJ2121268.1 TIR domain-containing protein [Methylobacterium sp. J-077]